MQFNDLAYFARDSEYLVSDWQSGACEVSQPSAAAYLSVEVTISTAGILEVVGVNSSGVTITENLSFDESGIKLSNTEFQSILTLTPTWSTYNISIKAEDKQGQPVLTSTTYGPYPISVASPTSQSQKDNVSVPGWERNQWLICYVQAFQPQLNDKVTTSRGWYGWIQDIIPSPHINFPIGWQFFLNTNK